MNVSYIKIYQELSNFLYPEDSQKSLFFPILNTIVMIVPLVIILLPAMISGFLTISTEDIETKPELEKCYYDKGLSEELSNKEIMQFSKTIYTECWENSQRLDLMNIFTRVLGAWIIFNFILSFSGKAKKVFKKIEQEQVDKLTEFVLLHITSTSQKGLNYRQIENLQSHAKDIQGSADWRGGIIGGFILSIFAWVLSSTIIVQFTVIITSIILELKPQTSVEIISSIAILLIILVIVGLIVYFVYRVTEYTIEYIFGEKINRTILYTCNQSLSVLQSIEIEKKKIEEIKKPSEYRCKVAKFLDVKDIIRNECTNGKNRFNFFQWIGRLLGDS